MSDRRLDIGIASYNNPAALDRTIEHIRRHSTTNWRLWVIDNASDDPVTIAVIDQHQRAEPERIHLVANPINRGYVGAVNQIFAYSETEYLAYVDNDATVLTPGWDEQLCSILDRHHEVGIVFPNGGPAPIPKGDYQKILWGVGFCWVVSRMAAADAIAINPVYEIAALSGEDIQARCYFDPTLGHQEEVDFQTRLALAGWCSAAVPAVQVAHDATASQDPAKHERISRGVVRWVDKWNKFFAGPGVTYHSPNVLRHTDWPPHALHMEEFFLQTLGPINTSPETVTVMGAEYDLIRVPRPKNFYRQRIV